MRTGALLAAAAAILVWTQAAALPVPARAWLAVLLAALPVLMVLQARQLDEIAELPRRAAYTSSMASLWVLAGLTAVIAWASRMTTAELGLAATTLPALIEWTVVLTVAGVGIVVGFRLAGFREATLVRELIPVTGSEKGMFAALSATAGITEEFVFRGFLVHALLTATGSVPLTLLLSSGAFGVVHAYQQPVGALRAALLGALLALPLLVSGSIYPAILAHILIDLLTGLWLARYLLR